MQNGSKPTAHADGLHRALFLLTSRRLHVAATPTMREMMTSGHQPSSGQLVDVRAIDVKRAFLKLNPALRTPACASTWLRQPAQGTMGLPDQDLKPMSCQQAEHRTHSESNRTPHQASSGGAFM